MIIKISFHEAKISKKVIFQLRSSIPVIKHRMFDHRNILINKIEKNIIKILNLVFFGLFFLIFFILKIKLKLFTSKFSLNFSF